MPILANARQERFAQAVASGLSADAAYEEAGYEPSRAHASRMAANGKVRARIDELLAAGARRAEVTVERVVNELAKIAFSDMRRAVKWQSDLITESDNPEGGDVLVIRNIVTNQVQIIGSEDIDDDTAACISEVSQTKEGLKMKFHSKLDALEKIGKHLGMWPKQEEPANIVTNNFAIIAGLPSDAQRQLASLLELTAEPEAA